MNYSRHPVNLVVAFALELAMLAALAGWGWTQHEGLLQVILAVGAPLLAAVLWGVFRVDGDPKKAPVAIPGVLRLLLELGLFTLGLIALTAAGQPTLALIGAVILIVHYLTSWDRVRWLIANRDGHAPSPY